jgi:hypothetical protein
MAKHTIWLTMIYKKLRRRLKIEHREPYKHGGWTQVLRNGKQFLLN